MEKEIREALNIIRDALASVSYTGGKFYSDGVEIDPPEGVFKPNRAQRRAKQ